MSQDGWLRLTCGWRPVPACLRDLCDLRTLPRVQGLIEQGILAEDGTATEPGSRKGHSFPESTLLVLASSATDDAHYAQFPEFNRLSWALQDVVVTHGLVDKVQIVLFHPDAVHSLYSMDPDDTAVVAGRTLLQSCASLDRFAWVVGCALPRPSAHNTPAGASCCPCHLPPPSLLGRATRFPLAAAADHDDGCAVLCRPTWTPRPSPSARRTPPFTCCARRMCCRSALAANRSTLWCFHSAAALAGCLSGDPAARFQNGVVCSTTLAPRVWYTARLP